MKGRNNPRNHKGSYGVKGKRPADYSATVYRAFPMLAKRPAQSSLAPLASEVPHDENAAS